MKLGRTPIVSAAILRAIAAAPGSTFGQLSAIVGGSHRGIATLIGRLIRSGAAFAGGLKSHRRYFPTAAEAQAWDVANTTDAKRERRLAQHRADSKRRYYLALGIPEPTTPRTKKPPKARKPPRNGWPAEHVQALLDHYPTKGAAYVAALVGRSVATVQRKAAYMGVRCLVDMRWIGHTRVTREQAPQRLAKPKPTRFNPETPKRAAGPAMLDKPADESSAVRIVAPRTPGRFEVPSDYRGAFSLVGIGRDAMTGRAWA